MGEITTFDPTIRAKYNSYTTLYNLLYLLHGICVFVCVRERQREAQTDKDLHYCLPAHTMNLHLVAPFTRMWVLVQPDRSP